MDRQKPTPAAAAATRDHHHHGLTRGRRLGARVQQGLQRHRRDQQRSVQHAAGHPGTQLHLAHRPGYPRDQCQGVERRDVAVTGPLVTRGAQAVIKRVPGYLALRGGDQGVE